MKFPTSKYSLLSELGSKLDLSFSSHVLLGNKIIALDGRKKKLLVVEIGDMMNRPCLIHLDDVKDIRVKKTYNNIQAGALNSNALDKFLQTILLEFEYKDEEKSIALTFYDREKNRFSDLRMLERNAQNWQIILSKMIMPKKAPSIK